MNINRTNVLAAYGIVVTFIAGIAILLLMQKSALLDAHQQGAVRQAVAEGRLTRQEARDILGREFGWMTNTAGNGANHDQQSEVADEFVTREETSPFEEPVQPRVRAYEKAPPADSSGSTRKYERNPGSDPPMIGQPALGQPGRELIADPK